MVLACFFVVSYRDCLSAAWAMGRAASAIFSVASSIIWRVIAPGRFVSLSICISVSLFCSFILDMVLGVSMASCTLWNKKAPVTCCRSCSVSLISSTVAWWCLFFGGCGYLSMARLMVSMFSAISFMVVT